VLTSLASMQAWVTDKYTNISSTVSSGVVQTDDIINATWNTFREEYNTKLSELNTALRGIDGSTTTDTMLTLAYDARDAFEQWGIDDEYAKVIDVAGEVLSMNITGIKKVSDVKELYDEKRAEVEEKALRTVNGIEASISQLSDKTNMQRVFKELKDYQELFPENTIIKSKVETIQDQIVLAFMKNFKIKDALTLQAAIIRHQRDDLSFDAYMLGLGVSGSDLINTNIHFFVNGINDNYSEQTADALFDALKDNFLSL